VNTSSDLLRELREERVDVVCTERANEAYIVTQNDRIVAVGDDDEVAAAFSYTVGIEADDEGLSAVLGLVRNRGGLRVTSQWRAGRYILHTFDNGSQMMILGEKLPELAVSFVTDSFNRDAFGSVLDDLAVKRLGHDMISYMSMNGTTEGFVLSGMKRSGIALGSLGVLGDTSMNIASPLGSLNLDVRASLFQIGMTGYYGSSVIAEYPEEADEIVSAWAGASSFLLADLLVDEVFVTTDNVTDATFPLIYPYLALEPLDILRLVPYVKTGEELRTLLRDSMDGRTYPVPNLISILAGCSSIESARSMFFSDVDGDLAAAIADGESV
jgi:hypothetical protein